MKIILIGTSPAMLLEAILLSKKYKNIEIHEKDNTVGGSWKTTNFFNKKFVETGSHIFAPWKNINIYKQCFNILKKKFRLKIYYLNPQPTNIINHNLTKKEEKKIKYFYIKGGAQAILNSFIKKINKSKIKIIFNSYIKRISVEQNKKKIYSTKGTFYADQVFLPHYCKLEAKVKRGEKKTFQKRKSVHILLEFLGSIKIRKKISYIQKVNFSKLFDRLCNLSNILNVKKNIFCVRLTKLGRNKFKTDKKKLINQLSKDLYIFLNKKLDTSRFKTRYKAHFYETSYRNKIQLKKLKSYVRKNSCKLVNTSEIITYISQNLARFKTL